MNNVERLKFLATRLREIDSMLNPNNLELVDEYNMIIEELFELYSCDKKEVKVNIIKWDVDWLEIKNLCRGTINMGDSKINPSDEWKKKLLIAEHSPLRHSLITVEIENIPYAIMGHLVRHSMGVTPYVSTSREDRTGVPRDKRSQMDTVTMRMDLNIQALINISRKRLCNQADPLTRKIWSMVINEVAKYDENIAWASVPEGIHTGGCTEGFSNCRYCNNMLCDLSNTELLDVTKRYDHYNVKRKSLKK